MRGWVYATLCVLGPGCWGLFMYLVFGWVQGRGRVGRQPELPPADYSI